MKWQVQVCGKLTWTRADCYNGITSIRIINENAVAKSQRLTALALWSKCSAPTNTSVGAPKAGKTMDAECLRADFVSKLSEKVEAEISKLQQCGSLSTHAWASAVSSLPSCTR